MQLSTAHPLTICPVTEKRIKKTLDSEEGSVVALLS